MAGGIWWKRWLEWYTESPRVGRPLEIRGPWQKPARKKPSGPERMSAGTEHHQQRIATSMAVSSIASATPETIHPSIAATYKPSGVFDELIATDGSVNTHWRSLIAGLDGLTHAQRLERIERINLRVRETGIAHDLFADPSRNLQPWRLDLVPLIFTPQIWAGIETAVIQRARLLEAFLADVYGPQKTLAAGLVPSRLVFSDPSYLRACQHISPVSGRIQFFAVDLARGPDGSWRIVDTHVETPAGIGYALANRTVLTHISGDHFNTSKAVRLAPFFQQMQDSLAHRIKRADPSIALLTPGPRHNDFFSHAYLARYLGFLLVEGDDLRADNGRVFLKTLQGLQPVDLVVRCVSASLCDALELDPSGFLGPVGLVQAVRQNPDLVVNALGTALAENRGLGGFLPALCKELLGEELAIWDVKKWWLGDAAVRRTVVQDLDRHFIRQAYEQTARPGNAAPGRDPSVMSPAERAALIEEIELDGAALVAEEKTALGTTPSYGAAGLEPKPYALRVFATSTPTGFAVMPGGLAMTVNPGASMALTAPDGASRDVWVLSDLAQPAFKSLWQPTLAAAQIQRTPRELPSRAADNLFWLGRYIEQADWTFRVLRSCLSRIEEDSGPQQNLPVMRTALNILLDPDGSLPVLVPAGLDATRAIAHLTRTLMTSTDRITALPQTLGNMHRIANITRDRLSLEAWRTLNAFYASRLWQPDALPASIGESLDLIDAGLGAIAAFNGLSHENMTRNFGWSFLDTGRRMSRALGLSQFLLAAFGTKSANTDDDGSLMFALDLADSFITYRSRYRLSPILPLVLDLLIVDGTNPRSLEYQVSAIAGHIETLPQTGKGRDRNDVQQVAIAMLNAVRIADLAKLTETGHDGQRRALVALLGSINNQIPLLTNALTRRYFSMIELESKWTRARSRAAP